MTVYTDSRIVEKYRDQLAQIFTQIGLSFLHSQCQLALEIEMLRKYTILAMLYKLDQKSGMPVDHKRHTRIEACGGIKTLRG